MGYKKIQRKLTRKKRKIGKIKENELKKYHKYIGNARVQGAGQLFVDNIHIGAEIVQDAPQGRYIEKATYRAPNHVMEQLIVQFFGSSQTAAVDNHDRKVGKHT